MTKIIVTAQVEDAAAWEEGFRTNGELFRSQTVYRVEFTHNEANEVAVCFEPEDFDRFMEIFGSPATGEAMEADGVKRETVKVYVMDKEFTP
jgi:hypothetical protein